jgi:hypothetical protein
MSNAVLSLTYVGSTRGGRLYWPSRRPLPQGETVRVRWQAADTTESKSLEDLAPAEDLKHFLLFGPLVSGLQLSRPLLVTSEQDEDGLYIVADDVFGVYGDGESEQEALEDYKVSLVDFYELASQDDDTAHSRALLSLLKQYIQRSSSQ